MKIHQVVFALTLLAALVSPAGAAPSENTSVRQNPLDQIAWLIGGTWIAEKKAGDGTLEMIEASFEWAAHKKLIKYSIVRKRGKEAIPTLDGMCAWHPGKKQLVLWEMDEGNLTESIVIPGANKTSYEEFMYMTDGTTLSIRADAIRQDENTFLFRATIPKEGEWVEVFTANYKRVR